ncbi:SH3 domain-containing protein, partial [Streptomyces sp. GbtcB7]|uniref:SH3 domain-containing protein n=1 Tax=Streptomyces sp. GbtcB7 TaxID=2824752 RepID=UPI0034D5F6D9
MQVKSKVVARAALTGNSAAVMTLAAGSEVTVVDSDGSWRAVRSGSSTGWVLSSALVARAPKAMFVTRAVHVWSSAGGSQLGSSWVTGGSVSAGWGGSGTGTGRGGSGWAPGVGVPRGVCL